VLPADDGPSFLRRLVEVGEAHGYDSIWLSDRVAGGSRAALEPVVALSLIAGYTATMKFGTSVLVLPLRNPVVLAKELATLDYLSGGRLLPAVGLGSDLAEYEACGIPAEGRGERTDEAIAVMRRLWQEEKVTHTGRFFQFENVSIFPKPVQRPCLPIWIGGRTAAAQRRVGRVGDGWLVSQATPTEVRAGCEVIFSTAAKHARSVEPDHIGVMLGFRIAPTVDEAASNAQPHLLRSRPDVDLTAYTALGPPDAIAASIHNYVAAGATKFVVRPLGNPEESLAQLGRFGREVLPAFHTKLSEK
jgi:probable F420-dependent oxidoreductase